MSGKQEEWCTVKVYEEMPQLYETLEGWNFVCGQDHNLEAYGCVLKVVFLFCM